LTDPGKEETGYRVLYSTISGKTFVLHIALASSPITAKRFLSFVGAEVVIQNQGSLEVGIGDHT
jgi:hypothetical protein